MANWAEFSQHEPDMAAAGRRLFYQFGPGLGFLATVGRSGRPRVHPITVALTDDEMYAFISNGPKRLDLLANGNYALHAFLPDEIEEEFMIAGRAMQPTSLTAVTAAIGAYHIPYAPPEHMLFRFDIDSALHSAYRFRGDWPPTYRRWVAPA